MSQLQARRSPPQRQRGAILVVVLMFLVLLTIISVSSISGVTLEEKMAGNLREQNTAFQAAESALRDAEIDLETGINGVPHRDPMTIAAHFPAAPGCGGAFIDGACRNADHMVQIVTASGWDWTSATKTVAYARYTGADPLMGVFRQPRYVIEYLPQMDDATTTPATRHFRVSARGWGANQNSVVTLQTVYRMPMNN
jgi:type IV pilus assembly protein PilX